jgi:hypothetical protein
MGVRLNGLPWTEAGLESPPMQTDIDRLRFFDTASSMLRVRHLFRRNKDRPFNKENTNQILDKISTQLNQRD